MGGESKKNLKNMLRERWCMSPPPSLEADLDQADTAGNAVDAGVATSTHLQALSKSFSRKLTRRGSFSSYNHTGPMIILDTLDVCRASAPNTPTSTFSGPIPGCPSHGNGIRPPRSKCSICLEYLKPGQGQALFTAECSHTFHFSCITSNVKYGNRICPICRMKWKDLPWQAGSEELKRQRGRYNSFWRTRSTLSRTFPDSRDRYGPVNLSTLHLDESASNVLMFQEPNRYDDDESIHHRSISSDFQPDWTNVGSCGQNLHLKLFAEVSAVPQCESKQCFTVLVHVKAPAASIANTDVGFGLPSSGRSRAPLDLVAVLDISGSMAGRKLLLLKQAMSFVIHNLSAADRLAVVVFSSSARRICSLRRMSEDGKRQALQAVNALIATGGTNISEGLLKGVKVLEECRENNPVSSIMLLSDGQDTFHMNSRSQLPLFHSQGIADMQGLVRRSIWRGASSGQMQIPVHTFGFGSDHDASMLHTISEVSGGTFSYIEAEETVQDAFAQCIGGLLSVVAQDIQLTISCSASGVFIGNIHSGSYEARIANSARDGIIKLGDLYAEEERDVLVDLKLPAVSKSKSIAMPLVQAACIYKDPLKPDVIQNIAEELSIMRPIVVEGHQCVSLEVDRHRNRMRTVKAISEASILADQGNIKAARLRLCNARAQLRASSSAHAGDHLSHVLELELNEIEERMADRELYERSGRAYLLSAQSSHLRQRATTRRDSSDQRSNDYQTSSMVDMVSTSQTGLSAGAYASGSSLEDSRQFKH